VASAAILQSQAYAQSAQSEQAEYPAKSIKPLEGRVEIEDDTKQNLTGIWRAHVIEYQRHPTVTIESQHGSELQGTYKGLIGQFPLTGVYDQKTSSIRLFVDFSKWRMARLRGIKEGIAILEGKVNGNTITGTANIPDSGDRLVHFEATRNGTDQKNQSNEETQAISVAAIKQLTAVDQ
jgi:hypothetical protein